MELRRYQEWGAKYALHQRRVLLGDDMGLGKTVEAIAVMATLHHQGHRHFLVVCPLAVLENWRREVERWWPGMGARTIHRRAEALQRFPEWIREGGVAITNYETLRVADLPDHFRPSLLVVDEAHYVKNPHAKRVVAVRSLGDRSEHVMYMTGTALENRVDEMIGLVENLNPEVARYIEPLHRLSDAEEFRLGVSPVYLRRKREEVLAELPPRVDVDEWLQMGEKEMEDYEASLFTESWMGIRRLSWNYPDFGNGVKARRLMEIVETAREEGRKVVIYSFFLETLDTVARLLGDRAISRSLLRLESLPWEFLRAWTA